MPTLQQWHAMWHRLSIEPDAELDRVFDMLAERYSEPHRHYHTFQHLDECLEQFGRLASETGSPSAVELAAWFHDAVYDTRSHDNEQRSADWAKEIIVEQELPRSFADHVHALIMATRHAVEPAERDAQVLVDVDLSILAADNERFEEYENQIRKEYSWVPELRYRHERRKILRNLLDRKTIYNTALFRQQLETKARDNIGRSLLKYGDEYEAGK